ncbi:DNA polymerase III, alpha subunit [Synechococcus sp. PCC 7502]|uniref:helix-hairpin-helix domain-containing protein n=1 Tax=Synechococcus sp. PCC 7502 TaxID=1173263 RepID=UPI00029FF27B|nr:OB-fold nucleic acid binding domain-containing protein [Synechococcus sp. PCC 7502]AFY72193.1 DNA polymerase III, alpha subunit [Synechococcus sp. PCC 7502]
MVKIVSCKPLRVQTVYDIGVEKDHNFILDNGLVASNCFNKSHSVAYGYVTYQTAYLKANYPVEYMAALLSSSSGDQDKVQKYIASCNNMGIEVLPPDINESGIDFTPRNTKIMFGLAAIKNLGEGAVHSILEAREVGGSFSSLADLCSRVDARALNKKGLEALIQTGAFDRLNSNRHQLISDLEVTVEWASRKAKDQASGQGSLFDMLGGEAEKVIFDETPAGIPVEDYPPQEKLRMEKELLGFYISDHPLKIVKSSAAVIAPINLSDMEEYVGRTITAIVLVTDIKEIVTKKGDRMAVIQIEDLTGRAESVIFPKTYEKVRLNLQKDARLMIWGKIDRRDEQSQLILDDLQPIDSVRMVKIHLSYEDAQESQKLYALREILREQKDPEENGKVPVIASIGESSQLVRFGNQFWVKDEILTVEALLKANFQAQADGLVK